MKLWTRSLRRVLADLCVTGTLWDVKSITGDGRSGPTAPSTIGVVRLWVFEGQQRSTLLSLVASLAGVELVANPWFGVAEDAAAASPATLTPAELRAGMSLINQANTAYRFTVRGSGDVRMGVARVLLDRS